MKGFVEHLRSEVHARVEGQQEAVIVEISNYALPLRDTGRAYPGE